MPYASIVSINLWFCVVAPPLIASATSGAEERRRSIDRVARRQSATPADEKPSGGGGGGGSGDLTPPARAPRSAEHEAIGVMLPGLWIMALSPLATVVWPDRVGGLIAWVVLLSIGEVLLYTVTPPRT